MLGQIVMQTIVPQIASVVLAKVTTVALNKAFSTEPYSGPTTSQVEDEYHSRVLSALDQAAERKGRGRIAVALPNTPISSVTVEASDSSDENENDFEDTDEAGEVGITEVAELPPAPVEEIEHETPECPACQMHLQVGIMANYAKDVAESCPVGQKGGVPKGYGGLYPLARQAASEAQRYAEEMAQREPKVAEPSRKLARAIGVLAQGMENVKSCEDAKVIADAADKARQIARRLTFVYKQEEAKKAQREPAHA